ncbi:endonuclease MutS2 [Alkalicoccobacillus porphyridii]|uniref:Endonuclease MutS2 n=1 Tax=Alkalicoccobacillus porphyridii TaxID=2597270 RepID=A0A553ZTW1_9BACI|nr:endonuclease MutS2 [Alkalicoccobacillus porphyridii]TSB44911.1 endonuclease MutS2 [Alkalicoccobacillus porphyridii]
MNQKTIEALGYLETLEVVSTFARTSRAKKTIKTAMPSTNKKKLDRMFEEIDEAESILNISSSVPIYALEDLEHFLDQGKKGLFLRADQFVQVLSFLDHCMKLKRFMKDKRVAGPTISYYAESIGEMDSLHEEINRCIRNGRVDEHATKELASIVKQIQIQKARLQSKAQQMVKSSKLKPILQDTVISERQGRLVLSVKKEYRTKLSGSVLDTSSSGSTLFIEPSEWADIQSEVELLQLSEQQEIEQILYQLTDSFITHEQILRVAMDTMHHYDVLFAKAKYKQEIQGVTPELNEEYCIELTEARHPQLGEKAVPLSMKLGSSNRALVITGPNTGGKTVVLKTVGLLTLMAQSGIPIPAAEGCRIHLFHSIYVDIGDGQSIEENLSTFSSRLVSIIDILREANDHSLVLLDELGSGTDPGEGMGLAITILEQLYEKGSTLLATTHYSEMKTFADQHEGFLNGSMEFDLETLSPTYRLRVGHAGKSQAFDIALKLGLHPTLLEKAHRLTYHHSISYCDHLDEVELKQPKYEKQIAVGRYSAKIRAQDRTKEKKVTLFSQGDNVIVKATSETGIVYMGPDAYGDYIVQIKGEKHKMNHKRLQLHIKKDELYPENYDFDQIFKSKEYRKTKNQLKRKHVEGLILDDED